MQHQHQGDCCAHQPAQQNEKKYTDPVCGMQVAKSEKSTRFQGVAYYFCSPSCVSQFEAEPGRYVKTKKVIQLGQSSPAAASAVATTTAGPEIAKGSKSCCGGSDAMQSDPQGAHTDPVCGMRVNASSAHQTTHAGQSYYFCCASCLQKFSQSPQRWLDPAQRPAAAAADPGAVYMCPMDPEIEQIGPGICPICGMALEPKEASMHEDTSELDDMTRRFRISLLLALPLLLLTMLDMVPALSMHRLLGMQVFNWLQFALATPVVLWSGRPFFERALSSFQSRHLNMFSLIGVGTGSAYLFSLVALIFPDSLPPAFRMDGMVPLYFEAAAVIISLVLLGQVLELRARFQTSSAIKALLSLTPATALRVLPDGSEQEVALDQVQAGDVLRVKPGAHIPVDGKVQDGQSYVDESMITGEAAAQAKQAGDTVAAGTLNQQGSFTLRAERVGRDTLLAGIIAMVNQASRSRAPVQKLADAVAGWFVPAVIFIALAAFGLWAFFGPQPALANGLMAAVSVLIIACPCALGLATPISVTVGIGRGASEGILIKDAEALQLLERVDTLIIDKTGTLTEGKPRLQSFQIHPAADRQQLLSLALQLERQSEHPLAQAIVHYAESEHSAASLPDVQLSQFEAVTGMGVRAKIATPSGMQAGAQTVILGKLSYLQSLGIDTTYWQHQAQLAQQQAHTVMGLAVGQQCLALISVADSIKSSSQQAVADLQAQGLRLILMTGDNAATANAVATQLGIREVHADVRPEDKFRMVQQLQAAGSVVAMAGDGINDAPALAQANVGIAMGNGTDIAMQSAHVVLVKGDLRGIAKARKLSKLSMRNIRQNLFFAFAYNLTGVPVAAGVLFPWLGILLSPMIASAAMSLSSVSVITNALRLRHARL